MRFLENSLSIGQCNNTAAFLEALTGFVDTRNPERKIVEPDCISDCELQVVCCLASQKDVFLAQPRLSLNDFVVLNGDSIWVIPTNDEVGNILQLDHVKNHTGYIFDIRQLSNTLTDGFIERAEGQIRNITLGNQ